MGLEKASLRIREAFRYDDVIYDLLAPHVEGKKVLSVGCGQGTVERLLEERLGVRMTGAEIAQYKEQKIETRIFDGKKLPFPDKAFTTTLFVYMLHHTPNPQRIEALLAEAKRVTKGAILILDHTYSTPIDRFLLKAWDYLMNVPFHVPVPFNFLKLGEWRSLFDKLDLKIETLSTPAFPLMMNVFFRLRT